ncbi:MAG TPA: aminotransferase class IV [Bacteroidia bacterium]|jgi:branched-subunit amino acid aminotransferase/4-amino-4-deoxychorismate lyase|nr:aminotransferase class IV [Bacteroidia bacterium]
MEGKDTFCNYNGHLISIYEPVISFANRAFRYGDSLFETIRVIDGKVMYLHDHLRRIKIGMTVLRMNIPVDFNVENISRLISELIAKNNISNDARVRLTIFRNEGGFYTPYTNDISFLLEGEDLGFKGGYILNEVGYTVDVFHDIKKHKNKLSNLKTGNALIYVLAGIYKKDIKMDDCLIINEDGNVCESISSNIFIVKNGALYTPALNEGCVEGVMRRQIIEIAQSHRILCYEIPLAFNALMNCDEMFLCNTIQGVRWVEKYKTKVYQSKQASFFIEKLNEGIV